MLNSNKTYDNSNLRDKQKCFNDGIVTFYNAIERVRGDMKATFYYSMESISYNTYLYAKQNNTVASLAIGVPIGGAVIEHGDIAVINDEEYIVDHSQYHDYESPHWYKVYLEKNTVSL